MSDLKLDVGKDEACVISWKTADRRKMEFPTTGRNLVESLNAAVDMAAIFHAQGKPTPKRLTVRLVERFPLVELEVKLIP